MLGRSTTAGLLASLAMLAGCATNSYRASYRSYATTPAVQLASPSAAVQLVHVEKLDRPEILRWMSDGWVPVGDSRFIGSVEAEKQAIQQARRVGAEVVLLWRNYAGTISGYTPMTHYVPYQTHYYTRRGSVAGATSWYPQTDYVPYTVDRYDQAAVYLARLATAPAFGAIVDELTEEEHRQIKSNLGVKVAALVRNSPAWRANILPGDIILAVNEQPITDGSQLEQLARSNTSGPLAVELIRDGKRMTLSVTQGP